MSLARKIAGNAAIQLIARISGNIIGVVVVALLTRYLGQEGFGNYSTIFAYLFFFGSLASLGLHIITISELNKKDVDVHSFYSNVYTLRFISALTLLVLGSIIVWAFPYPLIVKQGVMIISLSTFLTIVDKIHLAYYQTKLTMMRPALADVLSKALMLIGVLLSMHFKLPLLAVLWAIVISHALQYSIDLYGVLKSGMLRLHIDLKFWKWIFFRTWPIVIAQTCTLIYFKMDVIFLSLLRPSDIAQLEVGAYGAPYKFLEVLVALVPIFMGLITPLISSAWSEKNMAVFSHRMQRAFDAVSLVTWPLVLGGIALASPIMELIAPGFADSARILQILMIAVGIIYFTYLPNYIINAVGAQRTALKYYIIAAIGALVLYIATIPLYGVYAAAGVTVAVELTMMISLWHVIVRETHISMRLKLFFKSLLSSIVMMAVLYLLPNTHVVVLIIIGGAVYVLGVFGFKAVTRSTLAELTGK